MESIFDVVEPKIPFSASGQDILALQKARWAAQREARELAQMVTELREETSNLTTAITELREETHQLRHMASKEEQATREFLREVIKVIDRSEKYIQAQQLKRQRMSAGDPITLALQETIDRVESLQTSLLSKLGAFDVVRRVPAGIPNAALDHNEGTVERSDVPAGEIVEVIQPGYLWRGEALRESIVLVAREPANSSELVTF